MASNKLTKAKIERAQKTATNESKIVREFDGEGLYIQAEPNGSCYWRMAYRFKGTKSDPNKVGAKTLAFGKWPNVDLVTARKRREAAKDELRAGRDPGATFKTGLRFDGVTFGEIAAKVLANMAAGGKASSTLSKNTWLLLDLAAPLKDEPIAALERDAPKIQALLEAVAADKGRSNKKGRYESAIRLRGAIGGVFRYAIKTGRAQLDPTVALAGGLEKPEVKNHAAITDSKKFLRDKKQAVGRLLLAIDTFNGAPTVALALKLAPYLAVRPGELRAMEWTELDRRRERAWIIPDQRAKMRREHIVPLAPQALTLLETLHKLNGEHRFVFPNSRTPSRCMSEGTMNSALASIGYGPENHTPHGWRSVFSTLANKSREWESDVIEFQLAHVPADKVKAGYDRDARLEERIELMAWWADQLDEMRTRARIDARIRG